MVFQSLVTHLVTINTYFFSIYIYIIYVSSSNVYIYIYNIIYLNTTDHQHRIVLSGARKKRANNQKKG